MATQLVECVPNFSEGRNAEVIEAIVAPFKSKKGVAVLDYRADKDHNRLVVSLAGQPDPITESLMEAAQIAYKHINMETHQGGHPRVGAMDVVPFVPLRNMEMKDCIGMAHSFGKELNRVTGVPVYFYEEAALKPERKRLEIVRKGQYEALKTEIANPERHPDVGEPKIHPTAGACVVGARKFLIAFNVNLGTRDLNVAKEIAKAVRSSSGGLMHVKGIGLALEDKGMTQVSMNLVDYEKNALYRVIEMIRMEARRWGVEIVETELYGMAPVMALLNSAAYYMQLADFDPRQVVEVALLDLMGND